MQLIHGNALDELAKLENNSVHLVLTDPPYFLDKLDNEWNPEEVKKETQKQRVKSLPGGMKFDKDQGKKFYEWYRLVSDQVLRVLKPGGFFFSFSAPRLYHSLVSACDDSGFLIRDCFIWLYTQNQAKAMSLDHFIEKKDWNDDAKNDLKKKMFGWKTPQLKSCFEPICVAQKPLDGTFLDNFQKHGVGLFNTSCKIGDNMFPANVTSYEEMSDEIDHFFLVKKPDKKEKGEFNNHKTVKPTLLCEYLISLSTQENQVVLDPFLGSGTSAVASKNLNRNFIGIELNQEYINIAEKRIEAVETGI